MGYVVFSRALAVASALCLAACATPPPTERRTVLSYDGLTPIADTLMTQVWVREGYSLAPYRKVMLEGAGIQYRPPKPGDEPDAFTVTTEQKQQFQALITEEFDRALTRLTLPEVDEPGPDVLRVRGMMLDVVSRSADKGAQRLDSIGQATFVVELIDSQSNTVLVRALDIRAAAVPGQDRDSPGAREQAVRQVLARWADMLVDALNDLTAIDQLQGA